MTTAAPPTSRAGTRRHRPVVTLAVVALAVVHVLAGLATGGPLLVAAARDGWVAGFTGDRQVILWFLFTGLALVPAVPLLARLERLGLLPSSFGLTLVGIGLLGASAMPASGFWLVLAVGVLALHRSRDRGRRDVRSGPGQGPPRGAPGRRRA